MQSTTFREPKGECSVPNASTTSSHILIVDDDRDIREPISRILQKEGYTTSLAANGEEMFNRLGEAMPDLVLLDVMMPGRDGFELCRILKADPEMPPVIMLTAKDDEIDHVVGLELGAEDYIVKPFRRRELIARIKVVLRRSRALYSHTAEPWHTYWFDSWCFKPAQMELYDSKDHAVPLSSSENDLLLAFLQNACIPLSRDRLLDLTKGRNGSPFDRSIDSHVSRLRRKLGDDAKNPRIIKTAWGTGYVFTLPVRIT